MGNKKKLSAKQYLRQLEILDLQIEQDLERLSDMKDDTICTGGIDYSRERVQTSCSGDRLCADVTKCISLGEEINAEIKIFLNAKNQIIREIRDLHHAEHIKVLYKVYVQFKPFKIVAKEMKRSYNYIIELHKKALLDFEKNHENLTYLC